MMYSSKKVAVIGSTGQLGSDLVKHLGEYGHEILPYSHSELEVEDLEKARNSIHDSKADVVINCAAFHDVNLCEDMPNKAFSINAVGAQNIAKICQETDALCVNISTYYVFDGESTKPYLEHDVPNPINVYGVSKSAGETLVKQSSTKWLTVRLASLFGSVGARGKGGNFFEAILKRAELGEPVRVITDSRTSITSSSDASHAIAQLIYQGNTGIYHIANQGACSWYELACEALSCVGAENPVLPITSSEYPSRARRPRNVALESVCLAESGVALLPHWKEALCTYMDDRFP